MDVDADVPRDGLAPDGDELTPEEVAALEQAFAEAVAANETSDDDHKMNLDEVN